MTGSPTHIPLRCPSTSTFFGPRIRFGRVPLQHNCIVLLSFGFQVNRLGRFLGPRCRLSGVLPIVTQTRDKKARIVEQRARQSLGLATIPSVASLARLNPVADIHFCVSVVSASSYSCLTGPFRDLFLIGYLVDGAGLAHNIPGLVLCL